jgi:hypothetical protein
MARKKLLTEGEVRQFMKLANLGALSENYFTNNPLAEQLPPEEEEEEVGFGAEEAPLEELPPEGDVPLEDEEGLEGGDENEALLARVVQAVADELGVEVDVEGAEEGGEELEGPDEFEADLGGEVEADVAMAPEEEEPLPGGRDSGMYQEGFSAPKSATGSGPTNKAGNQGRTDVANKASGRWLKEEEEEELEEAAEAAAQEPAEEKKKAEEEEASRYGGEARKRSRARREKSSASAGFAKKAENLDHDAIVAEVARRVAERLTADKQKEEMAEQLAERIFKRLTTK